MNTDTYQNALESTKDSIEDVNNAIGFSLGSLTLEKLITSAVTLVICVLVIWLVMRVARRISAHSRLSESLSRFILKVLKIALEFMAILIVADSLGFNVTALLAVFSLLGLALSLSVQNCLSNAMSGITILLVEQNAKMALAVSDRAYVLETGSISMEGEAATVISSRPAT